MQMGGNFRWCSRGSPFWWGPFKRIPAWCKRAKPLPRCKGGREEESGQARGELGLMCALRCAKHGDSIRVRHVLCNRETVFSKRYTILAGCHYYLIYPSLLCCQQADIRAQRTNLETQDSLTWIRRLGWKWDLTSLNVATVMDPRRVPNMVQEDGKATKMSYFKILFQILA